MIINFKIHKISQDIHKLNHVNIKKKHVHRSINNVTSHDLQPHFGGHCLTIPSVLRLLVSMPIEFHNSY